MASVGEYRVALREGKAISAKVTPLLREALELTDSSKHFAPVTDAVPFIEEALRVLEAGLQKQARKATEKVGQRPSGRIGAPPLSEQKGREIKAHFAAKRSRENDVRQRAESKARKEREGAA